MCSVSLEWPPLASLVAKAQEPRGCLKRLSDAVRQVFNIANVTNPEDEGVIDHMVAVTTAMRSPFIAVACHTVSNEALDPSQSFQPTPSFPHYSQTHPPLGSFQQRGAHLNSDYRLLPFVLLSSQSEDIRDYFLVFVWSQNILILFQRPETARLTFACFWISLNMTSVSVWKHFIVVRTNVPNR